MKYRILTVMTVVLMSVLLAIPALATLSSGVTVTDGITDIRTIRRSSLTAAQEDIYEAWLSTAGVGVSYTGTQYATYKRSFLSVGKENGIDTLEFGLIKDGSTFTSNANQTQFYCASGTMVSIKFQYSNGYWSLIGGINHLGASSFLANTPGKYLLLCNGLSPSSEYYHPGTTRQVRITDDMSEPEPEPTPTPPEVTPEPVPTLPPLDIPEPDIPKFESEHVWYDTTIWMRLVNYVRMNMLPIVSIGFLAMAVLFGLKLCLRAIRNAIKKV